MRYPKISELIVLESNGGFYIGRVYEHSRFEYEPYSRESSYMATRDIAEAALINNTYIQYFQ